jgi:phenylpropionate dioxygenase-like ring-hydroxylating dioxygenase large terminal subunit
MRTKVTRRQFAKASAAVGAAVVGAPRALFGETVTAAVATPSVAALSGAAAARRRLQIPTGSGSEFRDSIALAYASGTPQAQAQAAPAVVRGWREGTTIPAEYYVDAAHYPREEQFLADHMWFMADHVSRIPKAGDYFVFEYGRGDSVIVLRDKAGEIQAFHNVCRHRGSRLCRHDEDPVPKDKRLSVVQLASSGNTPVFRCPYHAWTYDLSGKLISTPSGMPGEFDMAENGLHPCHLKVVEGLIFLSLAQGDAPEFDEFTRNLVTTARDYGTSKMKVAARIVYPTKANWKLALENFQECYHCGPAHKSLVKAHPFWDGLMSQEQRTRLERQLDTGAAPAATTANAQGGMAGGAPRYRGGVLNVSFVTGSLDGKAVSTLLPNVKEWTRRGRIANSGWMTSNLQCYDDHIAAVRFVPRDVMSTDAEIIWLVNADAKEGKDYQIDRLTALWDITMMEDKWIVENNHLGILSGRYRSGWYAATETGPTRLIKWYMTEMVPKMMERPAASAG